MIRKKIQLGEIFVAIDNNMNVQDNSIFFINHESSESNKKERRQFIQEMKEKNLDCEIVKKSNYYVLYEMPIATFMQHATKLDN